MDPKADYYGLLGLDRKSTMDEIRAAFRNLALKFHPDRNPDAEAQRKFRRITEAYDVLSDPETRKIYDQIGSDGLRGRTVRDYEADAYAEIYRRFQEDRKDLSGYFGGDSPFGDSSKAGMGGRGANLRMEIEISAGDAVFGIQKSVEISREEICQKCAGSKARPGSWPAWCPTCDGKGKIPAGPGLAHGRLVKCVACDGVGRRIVITCDACRGAGTVKVKRLLEVLVPARTQDGAQIRMRGEGDQSHLGGPPGDFTVTLRVRKGGRA